MRMKLVILVGCVGLVVGGTALPVSAHHAFAAEFDANQPIQLKGTIVKMEWVNPHTWLHIDVKDSSGKVQSWMIEGGPPTSLLRRGLTKASLKVGAEVNVTGFMAKAGGNRANGRDITFENGEKLFLGSSGTGAPESFPAVPK